MKRPNRISALLIGLLLLLSLVGTACDSGAAPAPTAVPPAPTATPVPPSPPTATPVAMLDINAVVTKYISNLPDGFSGIAPAALKDQLAASKPFLVDVREATEAATNGYVEGAVLIPIRTLTKNLDKLPAKDQPIVVYCAIGHRGAIALETLQLLGYTNVKSLSGGFNAWKAANLPVATGTIAMPAAGKAPDVDKEMFALMDKYISGLPDGFSGIAPAALKDQLAATKPALIDVREVSELTTNGIIESAVNVPIRTLAKSLDKLPKDKAAPIVVYCAIGHRGGIAMVALQLMGYTNVKSLSGGLNAWKAANLPVVTYSAN